MRKTVHKHLSNQRGVTLVELLAVIVILGILASVAVPVVLNQIENASSEAEDASGEIILDAAQRYFIMTPSDDDVTVGELITAKYLKNLPDGYETDDYISRDEPNIIYEDGNANDTKYQSKITN
ncbi:hypothetical protein BHF71_03290 [Vulcanibacillus modesticaldus]|uniref:Prepilin-type N-terminal cleavage/methylation domain-containing protein n=1 Tax=Vulcanibacillus modesticaldus TaxID=337097 RepID=A0A1D2YSW0_9BACI|nr:type II secretion system protein [Vulcanibacillus modesticaldus]OEF98059.1 hypothetical protein BHF71_03290 [Vulcanibacillus modesticaldus]